MAQQLESANADRNAPDSRYEIYERLRTPSGVVQTQTLVVVTGYSRAQEVLQQPDTYGSNVLEIQADVPLTKIVKRSLQNPVVAKIVDPIPTMMNEPLIFQNGERHREARGVIAPSLRPALIEPIRERSTDIATQLFAAKSRSGRMDIVHDFAAPLSVRVTLGLFGVDARHDKFVSRHLQPTVERGRGASFMEGLIDAPRMAASQRRLRSFFYDVVLKGNEKEDTPLLSAIKRRAAKDGDEIAMAEFIQLLVAGTETTQNLVTNGVRRMLNSPSIAEDLRSGKPATPAFRQEVLRHDSPSQIVFRLTQKDVHLGDVPISKGHRLAIVIGATNRDPEVFANPERFDPARFDGKGRPVEPLAKNVPLSFGEGIHACPGYFLAGAEADAAWEVLLTNADGLKFAGDSLRTESGIASAGVERLPVSFKPVALDRDNALGIG